jgi:hypothetical protein
MGKEVAITAHRPLKAIDKPVSESYGQTDHDIAGILTKTTVGFPIKLHELIGL